MNTPNPLVPQGSLQSGGKSTVRIAFFTIIAIHVVFIGGLLMQGCKKSEDKPVAIEQTNEVPELPPIDMVDTNLPPPDTNYAPVNVAPPVVDVVPEPAGREYVVAKGDSYYSIAKKSGVTMKAIEQANPGVNPTRLQVGQKLQIPSASSVSAPSAPSYSAGTVSTSDNGSTYTVKSGDMLEKIARSHQTTVKEIMRLNNLKTTMIKPGQKLKMPSSATSSAPTASPNYVTPLPSSK